MYRAATNTLRVFLRDFHETQKGAHWVFDLDLFVPELFVFGLADPLDAL
jgi:hypothetical protein